jgi:hypothetical protein
VLLGVEPLMRCHAAVALVGISDILEMLCGNFKNYKISVKENLFSTPFLVLIV